MKFKLRDYVNMPEFYCFLICLVIGGIFVCYLNLNSQEKAPDPPAKAEEAAPIKTWKLPEYMRENLQRELDDFNKRFEEKVQAYKKELKIRFKEFEDMPDDVILYLEESIFITRSDFEKLQNQLREKLKEEVKGDGKTTN